MPPAKAVRVEIKDDPTHLAALFAQADAHDRCEGALAYPRYQTVLQELADTFGVALPLVAAVFVSLSPNNDYNGNLRSAYTVLHAWRNWWPPEETVVSTYNHCKLRAFACLDGTRVFERDTRGLKILNFYYNLLDPTDPQWVTVDGHMVGAWTGRPLIMKEALVNPAGYATIKAAVQKLAQEQGIAPCAYQATVWFARKRLLQVRYEPQLSLFYAADDVWRTTVRTTELQPYPRKVGQ